MPRFTGAELVVRALEDEGIRFAFGIPGTHNIELYDALAESTAIQTVLITDEQSAGFMADAVWRVNRELACVNLVPGAGLTHALSGIAEAYLDGMALLVLGCGIRGSGRDRGGDTGRAYQLHDVDQLAIAAPVCKAVFRPAEGSDLYRVVREAAALARAGTPGPVMVEVSVDHYLLRHQVESLEATAGSPVPRPDRAAVERAAELLTGPEARPLLYLGWGAAGAVGPTGSAGHGLVALAESLGAPVATTLTGKGIFPESHPLFLWNGFGAAAPPFARAIAGGCSVTLAIGCRFSEVGTGSYSSPPCGPLIHGDRNPEVFGKNYPAEVTLVGDGTAIVEDLLVAIRARRAEPRSAESVLAAIAEGRAGIAREREAPPHPDRVSPARLFAELQRRFGPETIYATDSGNGTFLAMEHLRLERPGQFLAPIDYSCMGYAIPAAIGAKLARPDRPVVALPGDGALLMTGLELLTAAHRGVAVAVFVLRDGELAQIAQFQETAYNRKTASELPPFDVASLAEAVGVEWLRLDRDAEAAEVIEEAKAIIDAGRPVVVDTAIDYGEPTYFTRGVVKANFGRLPFRDRLRFIARVIKRRLN
jgi:acetolactate synthase-1/2/3 large subunit